MNLEITSKQQSIADQLAKFVDEASFDTLPDAVVKESKRIMLDSVGCAIGGIGLLKGKAGIEFARILGGNDDSATIFGSAQRSSIFGAAFANGELINALDFDSVLPPGHVSPYVLPGAMAVAEADRASGRDLILAVAIAHEMSNRFGKAMDYIRDIKDGKPSMPAVMGYNCTVFGATAAVMKLRGGTAYQTAQALAVAAATSPVNSHRSWLEHPPMGTIKYTMAGPMAHTALVAAHMAFLGHRGDPAVFDDPEFGYPRFIGTTRWKPENITAGLGRDWDFPRASSIKVYPHCRVQHGLFDLLNQILEENDIKADEIDAIRAWGEGFVSRPCWTNNDITDPTDAQFSIKHSFAVAAQRLPRSKAWLDPAVIYAPHVMALMKKVTFQVHPDWLSAMQTEPEARPSRLEVEARGQTFSAELRYPKGGPDSGMPDADLIGKFRINVEGVLSDEAAERLVEQIMNLENADDVARVLRGLAAG